MITSVENSKIKELAKLNTSKYRKKTQTYLVEGEHLVREARMAGVLVEAFSLEEKDGYTQVSNNVMQKLCNTDTIVPEIGLCKMNEKNELSDRILILDGVQDPGNLGALMRSSKAFGFNTIILGENTVDIYNDKAIRSSQGAIFKLNFIKGNIIEILDTLKDYKIYGTNVVNGIELDNVKKEEKMAIILGNEGNGISPDVAQKLEKNIYIPMDNTESLNVSVAGSIIMYFLRK